MMPEERNRKHSPYSGEKEIISNSERIKNFFMEDMGYNITNKNNNDYHLKYFKLRFSSGRYHDIPKMIIIAWLLVTYEVGED